MIRLKSKYGQVEIPDSWDELTQEQYLDVASTLLDLVGGSMDLVDFKLVLLKRLTGYSRSRRRFSDEDTQRINENLFRLAEMLRFPIRPKYENPEVMEVLSEPLRKRLKNLFPFEIFDKQFRGELKMVEGLLKYGAEINFTMKRNPLLSIIYNDLEMHGPFFEVDKNGLASTDIMAGEFVDAYEFYSIYQATGDRLYRRKLCLTLYRQDRSVYTGAETRVPGYLGTTIIAPHVEYAVFLFFQNLLEYLFKSPYGILFGRSENKTAKISLGMISTIYSLAKEGYGTKEDISRLNLADYLNMMIKQVIDAVSSLRSLDKSDTEIASELELPIETIMKL